MTQEEHFDVASYALGVLDDHDATQFEDHLIGCSRCTHELDSFLQVADLLADVDAEALIASEESRKEGVVLTKVIGEVKHERRRANSRRLYSLAAAVVVFAMLSVGAFIWGSAGGSTTTETPATASARGSSQLDPLPNTQGGPGIGGPDLAGQRYGATDPRTNVRADVAMEKKDWGTQISFAISNISGPKTCRLIAVHTDGTSEPLVSWKVGERGWGTAANPEPLLLQAVTATPREDIAHVQVQLVTATGAGETLVRVP
jgi:hypothetical protein